MIPNGYDLFEHGWPPPSGDYVVADKVESHPLYQAFLEKAREMGFMVESEGFQESQEVYFNFFLVGRNCGVI